MTPSAQRVALVTGAAGGIGSAAVGTFAKDGWEILCVDKSPIEAADAGHTFCIDLAGIEEIQGLCAEIRGRYSRLDVIVNNAAVQIVKPLPETSPAEWDHVMAVNVRSAYLIVAGLLPLLQAAKGAVVNVASIHALVTSAGMAAYVASKGALVSLTRAMALEFGGQGIRVNAVLPGAIDTPMLAAGLQRAQFSQPRTTGISPMESLAARHVLGCVGKPEDVAEAIYFLADRNRSSFITGQTLIVDGGAAARLSTE